MIFRHCTAVRSARSAALFVGSKPSPYTNVKNSGVYKKNAVAKPNLI
jgi:hypothetical protein